MTSGEIDMAEAGLLDLLKIGALFYPPLAVSTPEMTKVIKLGFGLLRFGIANGTIIPDGQGGAVTKAWADDPRHALNPDGTFKKHDRS